LGCYGDSGGVVTNNEAIAKKIKKLRNHGRTTKYTHDELGYAERMDNLQGAVLDVKLKFLDKWNLRRQEIADMYDKNLNKSKIRLIKVPQKCRSSYYAYTIFVFNREEMAKNLKSKNIDTGIHFPVPLHLQPVFRNLGYKKGILPVVEKAANEIISLPIHPFLKDSEVKYIISQVNKYA
jgi:dTDP-4-amino-4,6-dideoxygalactose transaminase